MSDNLSCVDAPVEQLLSPLRPAHHGSVLFANLVFFVRSVGCLMSVFGIASLLLGKGTVVIGSLVLPFFDRPAYSRLGALGVALSLGTGTLPFVATLLKQKNLLSRIASPLNVATSGATYLAASRLAEDRSLLLLGCLVAALVNFWLVSGFCPEHIGVSPRKFVATGTVALLMAVLSTIAGTAGYLPGSPNSGYIRNLDAVMQLGSINAARFGDARSPTKIFAFSDPVCPACRSVMPAILKSLRASQGFQLFWLQYPLAYHPHSSEYSRLEIWAEHHKRFLRVSQMVIRLG